MSLTRYNCCSAFRFFSSKSISLIRSLACTPSRATTGCREPIFEIVRNSKVIVAAQSRSQQLLLYKFPFALDPGDFFYQLPSRELAREIDAKGRPLKVFNQLCI
jgi:hypothetical protein